MKKLIASLILTVIFSLIGSGTSYAAGNCQPIYGGGQTCVTSANILIDKKVQNPKNGQYVDNLSVNDPRFGASQNVSFQLTVTNTGSANIDKLMVRDIFPQYVSFISGPGSFDTNSKTLSFEVNNLVAGESRTFTIVGQIVADSALAAGSGINCVANQSTAQIVSNSQMSQDNAQLCIQKGIVIPTTKGGLPVLLPPKMVSTPATGPEMAVFPLLGGSGILGFFLRRKSTK